jgi:hypothetical protein
VKIGNHKKYKRNRKIGEWNMKQEKTIERKVGEIEGTFDMILYLFSKI